MMWSSSDLYTQFEFSLPNFLQSVRQSYNKFGKCIIAVSEGIQDKNNKLNLTKYQKKTSMMLMVTFSYLDQVYLVTF